LGAQGGDEALGFVRIDEGGTRGELKVQIANPWLWIRVGRSVLPFSQAVVGSQMR
jgi:hypothetical protein